MADQIKDLSREIKIRKAMDKKCQIGYKERSQNNS